MSAFGALVKLYLRDLVRRRLMWIVVILALGGAALNYWAVRSIDQAMGGGASWAIATRRAASSLDELASTVLGWAGLVVVILAAQVSPESRRNGTTQFVLSTGVRRETVAAAQFVALAALLAGATLVTHVTFVVAGLKAGSVTIRDAAFAWPLLFVSLAAVAAAVLAVSLTASAIETCLLFLGIPLLTRILPGLLRSLPSGLPMWVVRAIENVALLFPDPSAIVAWPHATFAPHTTVPSSVGMSVVHFVSAATFWVVLGLDRQRRHDFGSRTAVN